MQAGRQLHLPACGVLILCWSLLPPRTTPPALYLFFCLLQAEADELNYILCTINAPAMVEVRWCK